MRQHNGGSSWMAVHRMQAKISPAQALVIGYLAVILLGTGLLMLPYATVASEGLELIDALFTATSAVCTTGLSVVEIGSDLSIFGQVVLLILIQVGALGFMTMSTLFALFLGRKITIRARMFIKEDLNHGYLEGIVRLVRSVLAVTALIEGIGILALAVFFCPRYGWSKGLFYALFHGISAFANAGFSLMPSSLTAYVDHPLVVFTIAGLVVLGGLGFAVIMDIIHLGRQRQMSLHSRIVLRMTAILLSAGMLLILFLEWRNPGTLDGLNLGGKLLVGFFTSVTTRTAGFEVVATHLLRPVTLLIMMLLMFIGVSPGSTGGGIKTTTFAVLIYGTISVIKGKPEIDIDNRRIAYEDFSKAVAIMGLSLSLILVVAVMLLVTQPHLGFLDLVFETVSAFSTAGLSTGITRELNTVGRVLLIFTMFAGRLGPLTLAVALSHPRQQVASVRYPEERISLG